MKSLLLLVAISSVVHAQGLPSIPGVCNDLDACEQACYKKGQTAACVTGGDIAMAMQDPDNGEMIARGLALFDKACMMKGKGKEQGHAESCYYLALNADDNAKARKYYERGCALQHDKSCLEWGKLLYSAGDDKSKKAAMGIYKKLIDVLEPRCDAKKVDDCTMLADVYDLMASKCRDRADSLASLGQQAR